MFRERTLRRLGAALLVALCVAALPCASTAVAAGHRHHRHTPAGKHHKAHHHPKPKRHKPKPKPKPKPTAPPTATTPAAPPMPQPPVTSPTPTPVGTPSHYCDGNDSDPLEPHAGSHCVADLQVTVTPSQSSAKIGDNVTFTITVKNAGPDSVEVWLTADSPYVCPDGLTTGESCSELPGETAAGQSRTITAVRMATPEGLSEDACAYSPELTSAPVCTTATVPLSSETCTSGVPGATQTFDDGVTNHTFTREGWDTFTKSAPPGSFGQPNLPGLTGDTLPVVYTGDQGMGWTEYPDGWNSTNAQVGYSPSTVQSVRAGVLVFYLNGGRGASISPLPAGHRDQTYGAWSFCERVPKDGGNMPTPNYSPNENGWLYGYHQAPLLWPQNDLDWPSAESDFPEADLANGGSADFTAYAHHAGSTPQDIFPIKQTLPAYDPYAWHAYTQTWGPGFRDYYVDGKLVGHSTTNVFDGPERWQLQLEPSIANPVVDPGTGSVYVKWVWIGAW